MKVSGIAKNFANGRGISKAEIEFLFAEVSRLESLAAARLADQESIEKHTARVCLQAVDDEPEYPGNPVNLRKILTEHKDNVEVLIFSHRLTVKATKRGIAERIRKRYGVDNG